jgi:Na+/H+ antiporter NhaD/arsenite permease-like protein
MKNRFNLILLILFGLLVILPLFASDDALLASGGDASAQLGTELPLWSAIPFVGILLSIAIFPLIAPHFWHNHFPKISAAWALIFAIPFLFVYKGQAVYEILHIYLIDYIPFIILLWGLFTISGGIYVKGTLKGTPVLNTLLILIGTALASWVGTTGAAMIMIRPLLRANADRKHKVHLIIFFIFLVANIGGSLTPLGDPPLFLGFLPVVYFLYLGYYFI